RRRFPRTSRRKDIARYSYFSYKIIAGFRLKQSVILLPCRGIRQKKKSSAQAAGLFFKGY
ncbi:MAG TPA: hypothetical protein DD629_04950, partial [Treponema sp.]|nr:hypothetical protein [Treponema sp.]